MIYRVYIKEDRLISVEEVDTSNPSTGSKCMNMQDYLSCMGDILICCKVPFLYGTLTIPALHPQPLWKGYIYVEGIDPQAAIVAAKRIYAGIKNVVKHDYNNYLRHTRVVTA